MSKVIIAAMVVFVVGLLFEKMIHRDYNITQITLTFKQDVTKLIKALFCAPAVRHQFDLTLVDDIKVILKPYAQIGFEPYLVNRIFRNVPVVGIRFVPNRQFEEKELHELVRLLSIKFREYVTFYGFSWKIFGTYSVGSDYVSVFIYYAEWESDLQPFVNVYRHLIRQKTGNKGGILRDEELEAELKNVDQIRL